MDRTLALHISALSPDEYDLYPAVLRELAGPGQDDDSWDRPVDVMEARGWIRGRYGLEAAIVDKVCRVLFFGVEFMFVIGSALSLIFRSYIDTKVFPNDSWESGYALCGAIFCRNASGCPHTVGEGTRQDPCFCPG